LRGRAFSSRSPKVAADGSLEGEIGRVSVQRRGVGKENWGEQVWHVEEVSRFPSREDFDGDIDSLIREFILPGHAPAAPILAEHDQVVTIGSCFAAELRLLLDRTEFSSSSLWIPSGLNNTYAILDFVSWCVTGEETHRGYRYERVADGEVREWAPAEEREGYLEHIRAAGAFVFTLGLAEVWEERETGAVFWRGVPQEIFDADRHRFRLTTVEENEVNLVRIVELIRSVNPGAPIVFTLSPVPLQATFRPISCLTADCVSKSTLRVALDGVMERGLENVHYWPSFEIVRWVGAHVPWRAYGHDGVARHVSRYLVVCIIRAFVEAFYGEKAAATFTDRLGQRGLLTKRPTLLRSKRAESIRWLYRAVSRGRKLATSGALRST
jgi:GSCFA family protein